MDSKVCECCQELTGGFPLCLDQFFFEKNDLQRPKMLKKWFLVIFKAHSPLRQKNGIFKRDQTQNHACLTQTNDFIPYTNIYNQIIIWGPYLAISGHCVIGGIHTCFLGAMKCFPFFKFWGFFSCFFLEAGTDPLVLTFSFPWAIYNNINVLKISAMPIKSQLKLNFYCTK